MFLRRVSVLAVLMLGLGSAVAVADPNPDFVQQFAQNQPTRSRANRGGAQLIQQLNLTPEQQQRLQAIHNQYSGQMQQRQTALRQAQQQLRTLMAGNAPQSQIQAQHNQVQTLRQQVSDLKFQSMLAMREVLTPEQRQRFAQLMQQRQQNGRNRAGNKGLQNRDFGGLSL